MSSDDVLSDVHLGASLPALDNNTKPWVTRFYFMQAVPFDSQTSYVPEGQQEQQQTQGEQRDTDGDLVVCRRQGSVPRRYISIQHSLATPLSRVGTQVWRGALLVADWLLHVWVRTQPPPALKRRVVLELGCGTGLTATIASLLGATVLCTDNSSEALQLAKHNAWANSVGKNVSCHLLDWSTCPAFSQYSNFEELSWLHEACSSAAVAELEFSDHDVDLWSQASLLIAADCVYDEPLTEALMNCAATLMAHVQAVQARQGVTQHEVLFLVALEKRYNFTLRDLDTTAPAYNHFCTYVQQEDITPPRCGINPAAVQHAPLFSGRRLDVSAVPQGLDYVRGPDLELWELRLLQRQD